MTGNEMEQLIVKASWFDLVSKQTVDYHKLAGALLQAQKEIATLKEPGRQATEKAAEEAAALLAERRAAILPRQDTDVEQAASREGGENQAAVSATNTPDR